MVRRDNICVVAHDATYGNCTELAKALGCKLTLFSKDPKGMYKKYPYKDTIQQADEYILVGAFVIRDLPDSFYLNKKVKIILVGTCYRRDPQKWNRFFREKGWEVYAMPELLRYAKGAKVYYHPFDIDVPIEKNDILTVSHSPGTPLKFKDKDTLIISETVRKFDVDYDLIIGLSQEETIRRRAKSHIFVDQLKYSYGKSSMEAMLTRCLVISGPDPGIKGQPPIVWVTEETLEEVLEFCIHNEKYRNYMINTQYKWAKKNLSYDAVGKRLYG